MVAISKQTVPTMAVFQNLLPVLKIYSLRHIHYRFSVLTVIFDSNIQAVNFRTHSMSAVAHLDFR